MKEYHPPPFVAKVITKALINCDRHLNTNTHVNSETTSSSSPSVLLKPRCCLRCVMRFLGITNPAAYLGNFNEFEELITKLCGMDKAVPIPDNASIKDPDLNLKSESPFVCICCLGILQLLDEPDTLNQIIEEIKKGDFQTQDFCLTFTLPTALYIRHLGIWFYLIETVERGGSAFFNKKMPYDVAEIKDVFRWVMGQKISEQLNIPNLSQSDFVVFVHFQHLESEKEYLFLIQIPEADFQIRKVREKGQMKYVGDNVIQITTALKKVSRKNFQKYGQCPPSFVIEGCSINKIILEAAPCYVAGRYIKLKRGLSNSRWSPLILQRNEAKIDSHLNDQGNCNNEPEKFEDQETILKTNERPPKEKLSSVEELISTHFAPIFRPQKITFISAGREDVDVRMLPPYGRPFILELTNPKRSFLNQDEIKNIQNQVNSSTCDIQIRDLQLVKKDDTSRLKEGEQNKKKTYSCIVWVSKEISKEDLVTISQIQKMVISQKTPVRVLHRRSAAIREKTIENTSAELINSHFLKLTLTTQAGTYIKEFIHGDLGRTTPSLGEILNCEADIIQLDVNEIHLNWPDFIN